MIFEILAIILIGLMIGSFVNVVVLRLKKDESFVKGRSYCPSCKHDLGAKDLIPIFSYISLRGKCRYCKKPISIQYPVVELTSAVIFGTLYYKFVPTELFDWILLACYLIFATLLLIIFVFDLKYYLIADAVVITGAALAVLFSLINPSITIWESLIGSGGAALFFFLFVYFTKEKAMGWGDVLLGLFLGALLGWQLTLLMLLMAFVGGAIVGIGLLLSKKKKWKSKIPFGTFLTASTFVAIIVGDYILDWYLGLLGI